MIARAIPALLAVLALLFGVPAEGARHESPTPMSPHHRAEAVQQLFEKKQCAACHAIKGTGGGVGPDLGKLRHTHNIYQMAAIMWNHSTEMGTVMEAKRVKRPALSPQPLRGG
ncbi:MAG: c-type cytochrome [Candidatus Rokubacteria bacterium]|nr:c-type cytochrome [Candidatus Rokubacteria bacterium]